MRVLIADDHEVVRAGIRTLLDGQPGIEVVAEATDGEEAVRLAEMERPDLAILDVKMPRMSGLEATRHVREAHPQTSVLVLSMHDEHRYLFQALEAGASGYVLKKQAGSDLVDAVRAVERGEPFLAPEAQRALIAQALHAEEEPAVATLTTRELEVVRLVAEALSNREIAERLELAEKTVENHRSNAMRKLGMRDRVELVRFAIRHGLVEA